MTADLKTWFICWTTSVNSHRQQKTVWYPSERNLAGKFQEEYIALPVSPGPPEHAEIFMKCVAVRNARIVKMLIKLVFLLLIYFNFQMSDIKKLLKISKRNQKLWLQDLVYFFYRQFYQSVLAAISNGGPILSLLISKTVFIITLFWIRHCRVRNSFELFLATKPLKPVFSNSESFHVCKFICELYRRNQEYEIRENTFINNSVFFSNDLRVNPVTNQFYK